MPIFMTDEELKGYAQMFPLLSNKADLMIEDLQRQLKTVKAEASLLHEEIGQKSSDIEELKSQNNHLHLSLILKEAEMDCLLGLFEQKQIEIICFTEAAALQQAELQDRCARLSQVCKLEKENSEEWSQKAGELEGALKVLETQLIEMESDYKEKLQKEVAAARKIRPKQTWNCFKGGGS